MSKMLRTIHGWRFELPLALLLAVSLGFMVFVMPSALLGPIPGAAKLGPALQPAAAALAALLGGLVAFGLMRVAGQSSRSRRPASPVIADEDDDGFFLADEPVAAPVAEPVVRVRRADAHPDAPPRAPILATRDLGEPFMDYEPVAPAPATPAIPDGDYVELPHDARIEEFDAWTADAVEIDAQPDIAAAASADAPAPSSFVRPERQSIADMMARLDAGMMRRSGRAMPPRDARPALRDALAELNRLAARRN